MTGDAIWQELKGAVFMHFKTLLVMQKCDIILSIVKEAKKMVENWGFLNRVYLVRANVGTNTNRVSPLYTAR